MTTPADKSGERGVGVLHFREQPGEICGVPRGVCRENIQKENEIGGIKSGRAHKLRIFRILANSFRESEESHSDTADGSANTCEVKGGEGRRGRPLEAGLAE